MRRGEGAPRPRLVLSTTRPSSASAVLDAVESAAGTTAAVSHVVFEPNGRAVGALMPAAGAEGQRGEQQVVIAGQSAQQVVISGHETAQHVVLRAQQGQQLVLTGQHGTQHVVLMGEPGAERVIRTGQQREQQVVLANQQGDQQVMLTSQEGEQQVMLTLDRELLRTVGVGDDSDIVLQVRCVSGLSVLPLSFFSSVCSRDIRDKSVVCAYTFARKRQGWGRFSINTAFKKQ